MQDAFFTGVIESTIRKKVTRHTLDKFNRYQLVLTSRERALCCRQRDELQGQREGPLWGGRCVPLWDAEGGAWSGSARSGGQTELPEESASGPVPADGQQAGYEALRQQKGAYEGTD